jgi:hypothetical protein
MNTAARFDRYRRLYEAGARTALFDALALCASANAPMPPWVAQAILRIQDDVLRGRISTYDIEFGLDRIRDPRSRQRRFQIATRSADVGNAVLRAHRAGRAIDDELFEEVASGLFLSLRRVKECWSNCVAEAEALGVPVREDADIWFEGVILPRK